MKPDKFNHTGLAPTPAIGRFLVGTALTGLSLLSTAASETEARTPEQAERTLLRAAAI
jgi:hypothetical protein